MLGAEHEHDRIHDTATATTVVTAAVTVTASSRRAAGDRRDRP
jgi:hypothetical protein